MAALATIATVATIGAAVIGAGASVYSAYQTVEQGKAQRAEYNRQAVQDELAGKNSFAASQREAEQRRMEGKLIASRAQAYAAASGGGSGGDSAPTIAKILTDTGGRAQFGSDSIMYAGGAARDDAFASAAAKRTSGDNNFFGSLLRAGGTLLGGVGHLAESANDWVPAIGRLNTSAPAASRWGWSQT